MVRSGKALAAFDEFSRANRIARDQSECLLDENESLNLKSYLSPTVLIATALEKFTIYTSQTNGRKRTYTTLFRVKKILKYENGAENRSDLFPITDQYSNEFNFNSLIIIEKFNENDTSCHGVEIKPDTDYILFLSAQNTSISIKQRKQLTYPVRTSILNKQSRLKRYTRRYSKTSIFVRMPVFSKFAKPIEYESVLDRELNSVATRPIKLTMAEPQLRNRTLHLECNLDGSNLTSILWLKTVQGKSVRLHHNRKYHHDFYKYKISLQLNKILIYFISSSKSILEVKNFDPTDKAVYTCFTFDYLNGNILNEKVVYDETNVTKNLLDYGASTVRLDLNSGKKFISCSNEENECQNNGQCFKTNPVFYKDKHLYNLIKTKFCMYVQFMINFVC